MPPGTSGERSRHRRKATPETDVGDADRVEGRARLVHRLPRERHHDRIEGRSQRRALERRAAQQRLGMRHAGRPCQRAEDIEPPVEPAQRPVADRRRARVVQAPEPGACETRRPSPPPTASLGSGPPVADGRGRATPRSAARVGRAEPRAKWPAPSQGSPSARGATPCPPLEARWARRRRAGRQGRRGRPSRQRSPPPRGRCRRARARPSGSRVAPSSGRSDSSSTSCTTTEPRKSRARAGDRSASSSRRPARLSSPPATSTVWRSGEIPARVSSSSVAASADSPGIVSHVRDRQRGMSTTTVARPPRVASTSSG